MRRQCLVVLLLGISFASLAAGGPAPCSAPEYRQLDFWLGDWDTYNPDGSGPSQARNHVDAILGGCAIHERYEQGDGLTGESFSIYDATRRVWVPD